MANDTFASAEVRFWGSVVAGELSLTDILLVPVLVGDPIATTIGRFTEDFTHEWCGMPFYESVRAGSADGPFCVCLDGRPLTGALLSPTGQLVVK